MIFCGSGSDFGKVLVPVTVPDPDMFSTVFKQNKICTKSCFFIVRRALFPKKLASLNYSLISKSEYLSWVPTIESLPWSPKTESFAWIPKTESLRWIPKTESLPVPWIPKTESLPWIP
jgi:hypothetical protein